MNNVPKSFVLTNRRRAIRSDAEYGDLQVGKLIYRVPHSYWCGHCDGTGCKQCKFTGIRTKADRRLSRGD